jgi:hypothetical protein
MELPKNTNTKNPEYRRILGEFYDIHKNDQWFQRAEFIEVHPSHMRPTIEVHCRNKPVLEMKNILQFAGRYNLALEWIILSNQ